jgi:vanillate/3-O-methylgallate O-demethylase
LGRAHTVPEGEAVSHASLQSILDSVGSPVDLLRNSQIGAYVYPVVASEFSNWRDEQRAWRESVVLFDQSHHMAELTVNGPDAERLLVRLGINSFADFPTTRAKHFVPCSYDGHVIGDVILFRLQDTEFLLVGRVPTVNWVQFHANSGEYDVTYIRDDRSPSRPGPRSVVRRHYRFQIQGPRAEQVIAKLSGGTSLADLAFFHVGEMQVAGRTVPALRHGMAGEPGVEIWGPYEEMEEIRTAILEAGEEFGIVPVGSRAYATNTLESGWIPSPLPAVYSGDEMKSYREWLPADSYEASGSIGGSFVSDRIEDYYLTPFELGYGFYVKFDHDFIGREALAEMKDQPQRKKVTFEWNADDVARVLASAFAPYGEGFKHMDLPLANYASSSYDAVISNGDVVGLSMFSGYSANERAVLSLGVVDSRFQVGDQLTLLWGEEAGGTSKPTVERHQQTEIRVRVAPVPYSLEARQSYAQGWRSKSS